MNDETHEPPPGDNTLPPRRAREQAGTGSGRRNPRETLHLTHERLAAGTFLLVVVLLVFYWIEGLLATTPFLVAVAAIGVLVVGFRLMFRGQLNKRFTETTLTLLQVSSAVVILLYVNFHLSERGGNFLLVYVMAMLFAVFRLRTQQLLAIGIPVIVAHAAFVVLRPGEVLSAEAVNWLLLTALLLWVLHLAGYITDLRRQLHTLTTRDGLTGAYARAHLLETLQLEKSRADRHGLVFCVALLDIDDFRTINETHGHALGDRVLQRFTDTVQAEIRASDLLGRYGSEEFMLILTHTPLPGSLIVLERIRAAVQAVPWFSLRSGLVVRVSIGVEEYRKPESVEELVQRADAAVARR